MLSIGKLATGQADYYLEQAKGRIDHATSVATGVEDYYFGSGEAAGRWLGAGAAKLRLRGKVEPQTLGDVLAGRHPSHGGELRGTRGARVPGFDLTFSAPKSVSVLFGLGDSGTRAAVRRAHARAVDDAIAYLERTAAVGRRGHGGTELVRGSGLIAAAFEHRTSRAGDPQLHTHVLIANLIEGEDGKWRALDGRRIYAHAKTAGYLYEVRLRAELTLSLGVGWTRVRNGIADIEGVPRSVLSAFSRRRREIDSELKRVGLSSAAAAQTAALTTRRSKDGLVDPQSLVVEWRRRAAELGFGLDALRRLLGRHAARRLTPEEALAIADELGGPEGLTRRWSTFSRRDAVRAWCEALPRGIAITVGEIEELTDDFLSSARCVPLLSADRRAEPAEVLRRRDGRLVPAVREELRYSTPELLRLEKRIVEVAVLGAAAGAGRASVESVERALGRRPYLTDEQRTMVRRLTREGTRLAAVIGKAGTGKTTALGAANEAWRASGVRVVGVAVARRAARELEENSGIPSTSLAALLLELHRGALFAVPPEAVVVLDEASMAATRDLAELVDQVVAANGKLVLVGDDRQLPSIRAGGAFRGVVARTKAIELNRNRRQVEAWERDALDELRAGRVVDAMRLYEAHDRLVVGVDRVAIKERLVQDWWSARAHGTAVMVALRRGEVRDLNGRARNLMRQAGSLTGDDVEIAGSWFAVGDDIVLRRNDRRLGVANGDRATIIGLDPSSGVALVRDGQSMHLPAWYLDTPRARPAMQHAYAITGHIAQGMTVDRAFVLGSDALYREWGYTAMSRGRRSNRLYVTAPEEPERDEFAPHERASPMPIDRLVDALQTTRSQTLAIDTTPAASLRRSPTKALRGRQRELRRRAASPTLASLRDAKEAATAQIEGFEAAQRRLDAQRAALRDRRPNLLDVAQRRRSARRLRASAEELRTVGEQLAAARENDQLVESQLAAERAAWLREHADELAELRLIRDELARRDQIERRINDRTAERPLERSLMG